MQILGAKTNNNIAEIISKVRSPHERSVNNKMYVSVTFMQFVVSSSFQGDKIKREGFNTKGITKGMFKTKGCLRLFKGSKKTQHSQ